MKMAQSMWKWLPINKLFNPFLWQQINIMGSFLLLSKNGILYPLSTFSAERKVFRTIAVVSERKVTHPVLIYPVTWKRDSRWIRREVLPTLGGPWSRRGCATRWFWTWLLSTVSINGRANTLHREVRRNGQREWEGEMVKGSLCDWNKYELVTKHISGSRRVILEILKYISVFFARFLIK
jgi:hypothetical protein